MTNPNLEPAKQLIRSFEGLKTSSYKAVPTEKYFSIGYGHYGPDVSEGQVITKGAAELLLDEDLGKVARQVEYALDGAPVNINQLCALCSFVYNIGAGAFGLSTMLKLIKRGEMQKAADEFLKWNKAGGKELKGLTRRRQAERRLFLAGIPED